LELQRWLILPDSHTPYHNEKALEDLIMRQIVPAFDWYGIVIMGDWFDNYCVSQYTKNPKRLNNLQAEVEKGFELMHVFELMPFKRRIFIEGNHETRLSRAVSAKMPEAYEFVMKNWHDRFSQWEYVGYMEDIQIGELFLTHDVGYSGALSTRQTLHAYQDNVVIGHNHNLLYIVEGNAKGTAHVGASFGWLGDVEKIDYRHRMRAKRDWVLGFGTAYHNPETGYVYIQPQPIVDYSAVVEGRLFEC
jgi:hypothetical protein